MDWPDPLPYAPKRTKPLSLWNPLDYLVLLYWVFYFPQALRWYTETFNVSSRRLAIQGLVLIVLIPFGSIIILRSLEIDVNPVLSFFFLSVTPFGVEIDVKMAGAATIIAFSLITGIISGMMVGLWKGITPGVVVGATNALLGILIANVALIIAFQFVPSIILAVDVAISIVIGMTSGVAFGTITSMAGNDRAGLARPSRVMRVAFGPVSSIAANDVSVWRQSIWDSVVFSGGCGMIIGSVIGLIGGATDGLASDAILSNIILGVVLGLTNAYWSAFVTTILIMLRFDAILLSLLFSLLQPSQRLARAVQRCSPVPIPLLQRHLMQQLTRNWIEGIYECEGLSRYSTQIFTVNNSIEKVLNNTPTNLLLTHIATWCSLPLYEWRIVYYQSSSLRNKTWEELRLTLTLIIIGWFIPTFIVKPRHDTPVRAACAGFWHLHEQELDKAVIAFGAGRDLPGGEELYQNAVVMATAKGCKSLSDVAAWQLPAILNGGELRPQVQNALADLAQAARDVRSVEKSRSLRQRNSALNRASGLLNSFSGHIATCPNPERDILQVIATQWLQIVLESASTVGTLEVREPVASPYIVGAIVPALRLVGRENVINQIKGMWARPGQLDSAVIFGHRRMGKSSLVRSLRETCNFGAATGLVVLNLQSVDWEQGLSNLCYTIAYELWGALPTSLSEPQPEEYDQHPIATLRRMLANLNRQHTERRYILILDEYEMLDEKLAPAQAAEFVTTLRGFTQDFPWLAVALVGLHTLQERSAGFYQAIYAWRPIRIGLLDRDGVADALQVEEDAFPLEYSLEAIDLVYQLTGGQPFLVQLLGDSVVQHFNARLRVQLDPPSPTFAPDDVTAVVEESQFYENGIAYFRGIWEQAGEPPEGQRAILSALAGAEAGLAEAALQQASGLAPAAFRTALQALQDHDVVACRAGHCRYTVELMRRWVVQQGAEKL